MAKIAIIDDSDVALSWAQEGLAPFGHEVVTYNRSIGITGFVRVKKPDVVLLDVNMEGIKGDLVCKVLKDDPSMKDLIVALYSSMPEKELKELAQSVGADAHIAKTNNAESLNRAITALLK
ncbi:MAG: response regulator [Myxococcota bacterium]